MEPRSSPQKLPQGKGNEHEMKEEIEVKLGVAEDTDNGEMEDGEDTRSRIEYYARSLVEKTKDKCFIHKVHSGLRGNAGAEHYEPVIVSIGPYHHGKTPTLQEMEKHKIHYLQVLLERVKEKSIARYIEALKNEKGEPQALPCYVHTFQMDVDSFAECMVLDGFFMIELFRRNVNCGEYGEDGRNDKLLKIRWMKPRLARDMLLVENQIPLFVLRRFFALTEQTPPNELDLVNLALRFFEFNGKPIPNLKPKTDHLDNIPHLLGLVYNALVPETRKQQNNTRETLKFIRNAVALEHFGVRFLKADNNSAFYDIDFRNFSLSIPPLVIDDSTESFFRNLVAYEQYSEDYRLHRVTDYLRVMACLLKSPQDVELLCRSGVIDNRLADDEKISNMFNKLCSGVYFDQTDFFYARMFDVVNSLCERSWPTYREILTRVYFKNPWAPLQVYATALALLLAALQVMVAFLPAHKS